MSRSLAQTPWSAFEIALVALFALAFGVLAVLFALRPLGDFDFWWHLKTGKLIVQARALLGADPFNFTGDPAVISPRERTIMQGYWLWQMIAYGCYQLAGFWGIKLLNALTLAATYAAIGISLWRCQVRAVFALPLLAVSLLVYQACYFLERPQIVSFLFAAILAGMFVAIRRGARPSFWLYPLMMVWGNMHGGVLVGTLLLVLFGIGSVWDLRHDRQRLRAAILWCLGGILAGTLNPNGPAIYLGTVAMMQQGMATGISEYHSTLREFVYTTKTVGLVWLLALVLMVALWRTRARWALADWLVSLCVVVISVQYLRNVAFLAVALVPMIAWYVAQALSRAGEPARRSEKLVSLAVVAGVAVYALLQAQQAFASQRQGPWDELDRSKVPIELGEFLGKTPLAGNLFNDYNWGGYLLWRLYPQYRLFIDGRGIDEQTLADYRIMTEASLKDTGGVPEYRRLLDQYQVDYVTMATQREFGVLQPLLKYLLTDPQWQPVYLDGSGFVLAKAGPKTAPIIAAHRIDKVMFLNRLLSGFDQALQTEPGRLELHLGRGELLGYMGRYDEAAREFEVLRQLAPNYPALPGKVSQLQKLREGSRR